MNGPNVLRTALAAAILAVGMTARAETDDRAIRLAFGGEPIAEGRDAFPQFVDVTPSSRLDAHRGWGWTDATKLTAWVYDDDHRVSVPPDSLLDRSMTCWKGTLSIRVPNGKVRVHLWVGDAAEGLRRTRASFRVRAEGEPVVEERVTFATVSTERWWLRGETEVLRKDTDRWKRQVQPILDEYEFVVEVRDGRLDLEMENVVLTALVALPGADEAAMTSILAEVERERRRQFDLRYPWQPSPDEPMPPLAPAAADRGFLVFRKRVDDRVFPWTRPSADEVTDSFGVFAARGEQEPFRFGILPLRPLLRLSVDVGDFVGPGGEKIVTARHADLWSERYTERGATRGGRHADLDPESDVLVVRGPTDYEPGVPRMFVLDLRVPQDAAPGEYRAPVVVRSVGREIGSLTLVLRVLPWSLPENPVPFTFQTTYRGWADSLPEEADAEAVRRAVESRVRFVGRYGFSAGYFSPAAGWGRITGEPGQRHYTQTAEQAREMDWWYRLVMTEGNARDWIQFHWPVTFWSKAGWRLPYRLGDARGYEMTAVDRADLVRCIREYEAICRRSGYPKHYWYGSGEADNFGEIGVEKGNELARIVHEAGGSTLCTLNGPIGRESAPEHHDIVLANHATPIRDELLSHVASLGHRFGAHNTGDSRLAAGYQLWRLGACAKYQEEMLYVSYTVPYVYLPWNYKAAAVYPTAERGYRPTVRWLRYRDGRDDFLYMKALEARLEQARAAGLGGARAVEEAAGFLTSMREKVSVDPTVNLRGAVVAKDVGAGVSSGWGPLRFARTRELVASLIGDLDVLLGPGNPGADGASVKEGRMVGARDAIGSRRAGIGRRSPRPAPGLGEERERRVAGRPGAGDAPDARASIAQP